MSPFIILLFFFLIAVWVLGGNKYLIKRRRKCAEKTFPEEWNKILKDNIKLYSYLPDDLKEQLRCKISVFIDEKIFEGCNNLEINDEIKVTIAAQACILLLNRKTKIYPKCTSILVYPKTLAFIQDTQEGHFVTEEKGEMLGESWLDGPVVLTWDSVMHGAEHISDGQNVVFHEFAHQLDQEDGRAEGYPVLGEHSHYLTWARHLGAGYKRLKKKLKRGEKTFLGEYAAMNPAEYFAVATEVFFEKPKLLKEKLPMIYQELKKFYKVNPIEWFNKSGNSKNK